MQGGKTEESNMKSKRTENVGHISSTYWSPFHAYYISFQSSGSQESNALDDVLIEAETKMLWLFEGNRTKLKANFAAAKSQCASCEISHFV